MASINDHTLDFYANKPHSKLNPEPDPENLFNVMAYISGLGILMASQ